jgi:CubicO group peptidase (beta-lactamase class C family)
MQHDTIFSVGSCTKPVTSTGLLILYDSGKLDLDDPVYKYIPEFLDQTFTI